LQHQSGKETVMNNLEKIRQLLKEAEELESLAKDAYWRAKDSEYGYDQDWQWEKEATYARQARARRAEAEALMNTKPDLKPEGEPE
jgi:hypothetical protein